MKKIIRLTESDLMNLVKRVINEQQSFLLEPHTWYSAVSVKDGGKYNLRVLNVIKNMGDVDIHNPRNQKVVNGALMSDRVKGMKKGLLGFENEELRKKYGDFKDIKKISSKY